MYSGARLTLKHYPITAAEASVHNVPCNPHRCVNSAYYGRRCVVPSCNIDCAGAACPGVIVNVKALPLFKLWVLLEKASDLLRCAAARAVTFKSLDPDTAEPSVDTILTLDASLDNAVGVANSVASFRPLNCAIS